MLKSRNNEPAPVSSAPPITTVSTTTTTTTNTTTTTTAPPTTTTTRTVQDEPGTLGMTPYSSKELLLYDTAGRYVQGQAPSWNLLLVNDWNPLPDGDTQSRTLQQGGSNWQVDSRIMEPLKQMLADGAAYSLVVVSGFRTVALQDSLYWRQVNRALQQGKGNVAAQKVAGTVVKRPGFSEHHTGMAVDLGGSGNNALEQNFENTPAFRWLKENCANYGFILRFPKEKEYETGVIYEPWHYRYVGTEAAQYIMENGLCLEEYLETHPNGGVS